MMSGLLSPSITEYVGKVPEMLDKRGDKLTPKRYRQRLEDLKRERSTWTDHWRDLSDHILPRRIRFQGNTNRNEGTKRNQKIMNNTATKALNILSSGMMAGITSPARPWFRLVTPNAMLNEKRSVRVWLEEVERRMREVYARSNIYNVLPSLYHDLGCYGTTCAIIEEDDDDLIRGRVLPIGSYVLYLDSSLRVAGVYYETEMSVEQLEARFGYDQLSMQTQAMFKNRQYDKYIDVVMVIEPNPRVMPSRADAAGMPYRSAWFEFNAAGTDDKWLGVGGFREAPFLAPRWDVTGEDIYGSSPGMVALPDVKGLQHMEKRKLQALDKIVNPPMTAPTAMRMQRTSLLAGDVNYVDATATGQTFSPAHIVDSRITLIGEELDRVERRIGSAFYADLFLMLAQQRGPQMTAREVDERHEEKMLQLGPVLERLHDELLDPLIDRTFEVMQRRGELPPIPQELGGVDLRVEYISVLAQAQKLIGTVAVERLAQFALGLAQGNPEVLDKLDADRTLGEYAELLGTAPDLVKSDEQVAQMRAQRQQTVEQQQSAMAASQIAANTARAAKDMSQADLSDDSALSRMLGPAGTAGAAGVPS